MHKKIIAGTVVVTIAIIGGFYAVGDSSSKKSETTTSQDSSRKSKINSESSDEDSSSEETSSSSDSTASSSSAADNSATSAVKPLSLDEAQQLIQKVGGESGRYPKIISQNGNVTVVKADTGVAGFDKTTFTVNGDLVSIHQEYWGHDKGSDYAQLIDGLPPKDWTTNR